MEAKITLSYKSERDAAIVTKAISPDKIRVPKGSTIKTVRRKSSVVTIVRSEGSLETFIATIEELLKSIQLVERVISTKT